MVYLNVPWPAMVYEMCTMKFPLILGGFMVYTYRISAQLQNNINNRNYVHVQYQILYVAKYGTKLLFLQH